MNHATSLSNQMKVDYIFIFNNIFYCFSGTKTIKTGIISDVTTTTSLIESKISTKFVEKM